MELFMNTEQEELTNVKDILINLKNYPDRNADAIDKVISRIEFMLKTS